MPAERYIESILTVNQETGAISGPLQNGHRCPKHKRPFCCICRYGKKPKLGLDNMPKELNFNHREE